MYQQGMNHFKGTQDYQIEAYDHRLRHDSMFRHQKVIEEMENSKWENTKMMATTKY